MEDERNSSNMRGPDDDEGEDYELDENQIVQTILQLGNEIWKNFGQEEEIDDVSIFFYHQFYIQCFSWAYPDFDFSELLEGDEDDENPQKAADCIQALIDLLSQEILLYDMDHIKGEAIVGGNAEHCINLLQILQQISQASMMQDDNESSKKQENGEKMLESEEASPIGMAENRSDPRAGKRSASGPDSSDNELMEINQQLPNGQRAKEQNLFDNEDEFEDKQQLVDNLDDLMQPPRGSNMRADKVGDVIGNELDIEFDEEIQDNILGRRTGGSSQAKEDEEVVDPDDVNIIVDGDQDFEDEDDEDRNLNRKTDNMADYNKQREMLQQQQEQEELYGEEEEELANEQNSSNYHMQNDDMEDKLKNLEIIDDQNLDVMDDEDEQPEDQHYPDEDQHYPDEDEEDEEEMMQNQVNYDQLGDIDPELLEAAQKLGLDEDGIRMLQQQMYQQAAEEEEYEQEEPRDEEDEQLAEMLNGVKQESGQKEEIMRGSQDIEDGYGEEEEDEELQNLDDEMAQKLKEINDEQEDAKEEEEEDEEEDEEEEDQYFDIDNLNDDEKAILMQYLQEEYEKNPDSLPMPKEQYEQLLADNQELLERMQNQNQQEGISSSEIVVENDGAMIIQGENNIQEDEEEQEYGQEEQEMNIEGGEQNIDEEEEQDYGEEQQQQQQQQQQVLQDYGEEEEEDQDDQQIFNPQYEVQDDQDNEMMIQNINVQNQQMTQQQQMQQIFYQQQQLQEMQMAKQSFKSSKSYSKKKKTTVPTKSSTLARKPLTLVAASKKFKRSKIAGNTIQHDDRQYEMASFNPRRTNSQRRPQTAKPKKAFTAGGKVKTQVSSTPMNRLKSAKGSAMQASSTHQMMIPKQSQMFTSFGLPQAMSQRKGSSNPRKKYNSIYAATNTANNLKQKKARASFQIPKPKKAKNQAQQQQFLMQQQNLQQSEQQQAVPQNLVEMPILSEEFLNQLNEEQLQALLEQQQQLMMLQQQNQQQNQVSIHSNEEIEISPEEQYQQAMIMQQQQSKKYYSQNLYESYEQLKNLPQGSNLRSRGRAKAVASLPQQARIPSSGNKGPGLASSASRSRHGSKKRNQKGRNSLNAIGQIAGATSHQNIGVPSALQQPNFPASITKSQKLAAQIYGNSDNMLNNLVSQRKKSSSQGKKTKKRSQPNQGLAQKNYKQFTGQNPNSAYNLQAQLQAQQAQYNQQQQYIDPNQQYQVQIGPDGQQVYVPVQMKSEEDMMEEEAIDEVSPEQEDGESQNQFQNKQQSNIHGGQISNIADDLSTEQIIELLQNAQNQSEMGAEANYDENGELIQQGHLPEEIQLQLQQVLQERMLQQQQQEFLLQQQQMADARDLNQPKLSGMSDRVQSYQNICNILTESVSKAKQRYQHLAPGADSQSRKISASNSPEQRNIASKIGRQTDLASLETDQRIKKQKQQFEQLLKQYQQDMRKEENKRIKDQKRAQKIAARDEKIKAIKQKRFEDELLNQQRSQMFKRNAQQVRLCKKVYKLASDLEKNKLLDEKKLYKESEENKQHQKKAMVQTIENYYQDKINMLKERINREKFERQIAQEAQKKALSQMKKELDDQKRKEVQRYIELLQQEDDKYDLQNMNLGRLQGEIVKLYKKQ